MSQPIAAERFLNVPETWEGEESIWGSMAVVVRTAYHLGPIRQALSVVRARQP